MSPAPNIISASRGIAGFAMLLFPVFSPWFWALYCWGGLSDMIDGPLARKLGTVSETGSMVDSLADLVFIIGSAILVLPTIDLPLWVWLWIAAIGVIKLVGITIGSCRQRKLAIPHSTTNKLSGILLFCLPFALIHFGALIPSVTVCAMAIFSLLEDIRFIRPYE